MLEYCSPSREQMAAGATHSFFLTATGELYGCGKCLPGDSYDKVITTWTRLGTPVSPTKLYMGWHHTFFLVVIATAAAHFFLLTSDGRVYGQGYNADRELSEIPTPEPVTEIVTGSDHSFLRTVSGKW